MPISDTIMLLANCDVISNATHNNYFNPNHMIHLFTEPDTLERISSDILKQRITLGCSITKVTNYSYNTLLEVKSV